MALNDKRALGLLVFHALRKAVENFDTDTMPADRDIEEIIIKVITLLPRMGAMQSEIPGKVYLQWLPESIEKQASTRTDVLLDIQPIIDSIKTVWCDYIRLLEKAPIIS